MVYWQITIKNTVLILLPEGHGSICLQLLPLLNSHRSVFSMMDQEWHLICISDYYILYILPIVYWPFNYLLELPVSCHLPNFLSACLLSLFIDLLLFIDLHMLRIFILCVIYIKYIIFVVGIFPVVGFKILLFICLFLSLCFFAEEVLSCPLIVKKKSFT